MLSREIWSFTFFLGLFLFNWPFLNIFSLSLPIYFFSVWALFILAIMVFGRLQKDRNST